LKTTVN